MNKIKLTLVVLIVLATAISCIDPLYPNEQMLQHLGTLALLIPLTRDLFKTSSPYQPLSEYRASRFSTSLALTTSILMFPIRNGLFLWA